MEAPEAGDTYPLKTGTRTIDGAVPTDYDGPFIPGGLAPGELRTNDLALDFVKGFAETGREHLSRTARIRYLRGRVEEEVAKLAAHLPETIRVKEAELGAEERRLGSTPSSSAPFPRAHPISTGRWSVPSKPTGSNLCDRGPG